MTLRVAWIVVGVVVVALGGAWLALAPPSERAFHAKVAELQGAGEPVDFAGLAGPAAPADENGAPAILDAWEWEKENVPSQAREGVVGPWNPPADGDWMGAATPADLAKLADALDALTPYVDRLHAALAKPRLDFRAEKLTAFGFPDDRHLSAVQEAGRVLGAAAVVARDAPRRLDAMADSLALATRIEHPDAIDLMVGTVHAKNAIRALRMGIESGTLDPKAARARLDGALRAAWLPRLRDALRADRVLIVQAYRSAIYGVEFVPDKRTWLARFWDRTVRSEQGIVPSGMASKVAVHLDALTSALAVPVAPWPSYRSAVIEAMGPAARDDAPLGTALMAERETSRFLLADAQSRLARVALAVAERRSATGAWPASLDALKDVFRDGVPVDPYTGAPFVYEVTAAGVRFASVGAFADRPSDEDAMPRRDRLLEWTLKP